MSLNVYGPMDWSGVRAMAGKTYPYKEFTLEKPLLDVLWVTSFPFVQASNPVVLGRTVAVDLIADLRANARIKSQQHDPTS